jgi:tetratricopeptide (TPR) repeat protein
MRSLAASLVLLVAGTVTCAGAGTLSDARQRWLHGNYEEARALYEQLAQEPAHRAAAIVGISKTLQSQGQYDRALAVVDAALRDKVDSAELHARRAELLHLRGRWDEALGAAEEALRRKPDQFLARWVRGRIAWQRGDVKKADEEFRWFVRTYSERSSKDDDIKDPDELLLVAQAGAENARWHRLSDQFRVILTDVLGDALKADKDFWPAEHLAGRLLLEKYNQAEAQGAFDKALAINPNAAEVLVSKGQAALQRYETADAEQMAVRALHVNPHLPEAHRLLADVHLLAHDLSTARRELEAARAVDPRDERTLGRWAACLVLARDERGLADLVRDVERFDPKPGVCYQELAERLEERRRYEPAEQYYKKALELRPLLPGPLNGLGLLYMRLGQEKEAAEILGRAFKADEFNVRVANALKVLRHLERYETVRTAHFEIRFDPKNDPKLARYMAGYLEEVYTQLASRFGYQPARPILVEVFNNHEMFSGRIIALPDLHTIGASTGRIVALVSPNGHGLRRPFNWARVLRHELVHVFNLEQTGFQVPHWFTEGLAVIQEAYPRPAAWNRLLCEKADAGELLNLDSIELGFIRPRSSVDWHLAYCQSQLYVEHLTSRYGADVIGKMLAAYGEGLDTPEVLRRVCMVDQAAFEKSYRAYVDQIVQTVRGRPREKRLTLPQLQKAYEAEPDNAELAGRLAEQYLLRRDRKEARRLAEAALAKRPNQPLAAYVKARLLLDAGDEEQARTFLVGAVDRLNPEPRVLRALGKLYFEAHDFEKAGQIYELGHRAEPYENRWLVELLRVYTQARDRAKQIEILEQLVPTEPDDLDQRKRLAQLLLEAGRPADAARYAREALEIDVRDAEALESLTTALRAQGKDADARRVSELLGN